MLCWSDAGLEESSFKSSANAVTWTSGGKISRRGLWASEKPTDEWSERINGGTCEQLVKELGRFVKTKSRKLFRPDAAVLVGKCTIWTKSCETIKSLRESGIPFGILKSEDQVAFGKLKSPNM
uniref:Uncharacterized protein n=1 Tax=Caenorhabditis japonica TaxID=281687 RepID=A0A2Q4SVU5_CAEJA